MIPIKVYHELVGGTEYVRPGSDVPETINEKLVAEYIANKRASRNAIVNRFRAIRGLPQSED